MKLSLAWIFDHIKTRRAEDYNVYELLKSLRGSPAEIDSVHEIALTWDDFSMVKIIEISAHSITAESVEWCKKITLSARADARIGVCFLVKAEEAGCRWATLVDFGGEKEGLAPELWCAQEDIAGGWKKRCEARDYILEVDNKSITNRPDMWGHRGFAREMAALLGLEMVSEELLVASLPIQHYTQKSGDSAVYRIALDSKTCDRFAGIEVTPVAHAGSEKLAGLHPSLPWMAVRLARVDTRARNLIVDLTNYVMFDVAQPMHAFDAEKISNTALVVRQAHAGEKLALLDDTVIELTPQDCVIADDHEALSLAGIIGGQKSSVHAYTKKIFLEAAHFDGPAIRLTAARFKKRTESSLRFEKVLDPHGNTAAILRYLKLLDDAGVVYTTSGSIISVGPLAPVHTIVVEQRFIMDRLGTTVLSDQAELILKRLGFGVQVGESQRGGGVYTLTVPTWRASKDVTIKEDIVEEVGRCLGYANINPIMPTRSMTPQDHTQVYFRRSVKQQCAYALFCRESFNYALYDEQFLHKMGYEIQGAASVKNPVSEHWRRLVTSLVPHLIKNVSQNCANEDRLRFFEWARAWHVAGVDGVDERISCAGIFYERNASMDFYEGKAAAQSLFDLLDLLVEWRKPDASRLLLLQPWMNPHKTAELVCQNQVIGYAGMLADSFENAGPGNAFVFEINMSCVMALKPLEHRFEESAKYQPVDLDISMLVPYTTTVADLEEALAHADARIKDIVLLDVFEKDEWKDQRSVTLRCRVQDDEKTMTKEDIDQIQKALTSAVSKRGAQVR
jgi:phenylalanyl-tRNA synthetase beta chain